MCGKKILESSLISEAIVNKLLTLIPKNLEGITCGIIDLGVIGKAVASKLLSMNYQVMVYDRHFQSSKTLKGVTFIDKLDKIASFFRLYFWMHWAGIYKDY